VKCLLLSAGVLTAVNVLGFRVVTPWRLLGGSTFRGAYCLHLQGRRSIMLVFWVVTPWELIGRLRFEEDTASILRVKYQHRQLLCRENLLGKETKTIDLGFKSVFY
jgi:hypothetical protein